MRSSSATFSACSGRCCRPGASGSSSLTCQQKGAMTYRSARLLQTVGCAVWGLLPLLQQPSLLASFQCIRQHSCHEASVSCRGERLA